MAKSYKWAMEEFGEGQSGEVEERVPASEDVEQAMLEVGETGDNVTDAIEDIDQMTDDAEQVEGIAAVLDDTTEEGGAAPETAQVAVASLESLYKKYGVRKRAIPSMESFGGRRTRLDATHIAVEGLKEFATKIWEAIKNAFNAVVKWVKEFLKKVFDANIKLKARAEKAYKAALLLKGSPKTEEWDDMSLFVALSSDGKKFSVIDLVSGSAAMQTAAQETRTEVSSIMKLMKTTSEHDVSEQKDGTTMEVVKNKFVTNTLGGNNFEIKAIKTPTSIDAKILGLDNTEEASVFIFEGMPGSKNLVLIKPKKTWTDFSNENATKSEKAHKIVSDYLAHYKYVIADVYAKERTPTKEEAMIKVPSNSGDLKAMADSIVDMCTQLAKMESASKEIDDTFNKVLSKIKSSIDKIADEKQTSSKALAGTGKKLAAITANNVAASNADKVRETAADNLKTLTNLLKGSAKLGADLVVKTNSFLLGTGKNVIHYVEKSISLWGNSKDD